MKTKKDIVDNWLPRYTGRELKDFSKYILRYPARHTYRPGGNETKKTILTYGYISNRTFI